MIQIFVDTSTWGHWFDWQDGADFADHPDIQKDIEAFEQIYNLVSSQPERFVFLYNALVYHPQWERTELPKQYFLRFEQIVLANLLKKVVIPGSRVDNFLLDGSLGFGGEFGFSLRGLLSLHNDNDHEEKIKQHWPDLSRSEVFSEKTRFMIRDISFTKLQESNVPEEVLQALQSLKNRLKPNKRKFLKSLQAVLEPAWLDQYRDLILRYAFYDTLPRKEEYDIEHLESALEANADFFLTDDDNLVRLVNRAAERYYTFAYQRAKEICMHPVAALPKLHRR